MKHDGDGAYNESMKAYVVQSSLPGELRLLVFEETFLAGLYNRRH